jgi:cation diffusion facilitator CzcD-associated flavoprotein CzcO
MAEQVTELPVVIVGSGFSGIAMGAMLRRAGIDSFVILEKAADVGGTWRENTYPGAACDVPSHLYSFSFEPKADWSRAFSPQEEIQAYLRHVVCRYDLGRHIRFGARVTGGEFDEASGTWLVGVEGRPPIRARALVLGNGALHIPAMPDIPGLERFEGRLFHSARWDHAYDFTDRDVAVIGTGASAIQFVPQIAPRVRRLHVFQRTPPWIVPKPDRPMRPWEQRLFRAARPIHWIHRALLYWALELRVLGFLGWRRLMKPAEQLALRHLASVVDDPELRRKLTPTYTMGCKRILLSNDYYQALVRPNVELVTDGIARITRDGVVTRDGTERRVDAIICGTGFAATDYLAPFDLVGRGGRRLADVMRQNAETYLGIAVHGFPNLFLLMGPNTGLGHNSMIFMIEAQARYTLQAIRALRERHLASVEVRAPVQARFGRWVQERLRRSVWASGCASWYLKDGHNSTIWPSFTFAYWWRTRRLALAEYECVPAGREETAVAAVPARVVTGEMPAAR